MDEDEQYETATRTIDHLTGEVKYARRPHAMPLRYRIHSDRLSDGSAEAKRLDRVIQADVRQRNDENAIDLYVWAQGTTEDGETIEGLTRIVQDEQFKVVSMEWVPS